MPVQTAESLTPVVEPVLARCGCDLEEIDVRGGGRTTVLRILVDADRRPDLDTLAAISEEISQALDDAGAFGEKPYTLEVSTPGVGRPLTLPRHWRRAVGRRVTVRATPDAGGDTTVGRVARAGAGSVDLIVRDGRELMTRTLDYDAVAEAVVEVEFAAPPRDEMRMIAGDARGDVGGGTDDEATRSDT